VGKTLTAESIAEEMKVPLFMMSAGDLGLDPRSVESKLQNIMEMCTRWNAILLLDEADVFLEERSLHELERNKLVSIFLRVLEYFEGIMFLTTNRVNTFDSAFQSRIHISLNYPELSEQSRRIIWTNFLDKHNKSIAERMDLIVDLGVDKRKRKTPDEHKEEDADIQSPEIESNEKKDWSHTITPSQLNKLAHMETNGRQIKNILKAAQLLSVRRGERLSYEHIDQVLEGTQHLHKENKQSEETKSSLFY
jgi:SpoVK/Ycf46/Vps4 family AAA+-type ATPase